MFNFKLIILFVLMIAPVLGVPKELLKYEIGSYVNPNPRPYKKCSAQDLVTLSGCCNDALIGLNVCKSDDLACECCALQSIKSECYSLCPGNPSANFLSVLMSDCALLNEVNACSLPFKKIDDDLSNRASTQEKVNPELDATIQSKVRGSEVIQNESVKLLFDYDGYIEKNEKEKSDNKVGKHQGENDLRESHYKNNTAQINGTNATIVKATGGTSSSQVDLFHIIGLLIYSVCLFM